MIILVWANFVVNILIVLFLLYKFLLYRMTFQWDRTFWAKYKNGLEIWWWNKNRIYGTRILYIPIASKAKLEKKIAIISNLGR